MPFATYIIYSPILDRYYMGQAEDPKLRLERDHNGGRSKSTKAGRRVSRTAPWLSEGRSPIYLSPMTHPSADIPMSDILGWDVGSWEKALACWERSLAAMQPELALELGGREGGLSLWLASKGIRTVCSDLSGAQLTASPLHAKYHVDPLIEYEDINAVAIPYKEHFDVVVFKSIVGGIGRGEDGLERQREVFRQAHKALKPGGRLFFAENLTASPLHRFLRKRFTDWGTSWRYVSIAEIESFLMPFTSYTLHTTGVVATFGRTERQRLALAKIDRCLLNRVCPAEWRYIAYGVAEKAGPHPST